MKKKFIVVRAVRWEEKTWWTDPECGFPKPVDKETARKALIRAQKTYPDHTYKLKEVKE